MMVVSYIDLEILICCIFTFVRKFISHIDDYANISRIDI